MLQRFTGFSYGTCIPSTLPQPLWQPHSRGEPHPQMTEFLSTILSYPTIIFSVLLVLAFAYWTMVIVGAIGMDALDFEVSLDSGAEAAGEGVAEAAGEGVAEAAGEGAAEAAAEGASEGAGEGLTGAIAGLLHALRLRDVPLTLVLSLVVLFAWCLSQLGSVFLLSRIPGWSVTLWGTALMLASFVGGLVVASACVRPLARLLKVERQTRRSDWIGKVVRISTSRVDPRFGTALAEDGGAGLILQVRCETPNSLERGSKALVVAFDSAKDAYEVTAVDDILLPGAEEKL